MCEVIVISFLIEFSFISEYTVILHDFRKPNAPFGLLTFALAPSRARGELDRGVRRYV